MPLSFHLFDLLLANFGTPICVYLYLYVTRHMLKWISVFVYFFFPPLPRRGATSFFLLLSLEHCEEKM